MPDAIPDPPGLAPPWWRTAALVGPLLLALGVLYGWQSWQQAKEEQTQQLATVAELIERAADRYFLQIQGSLALMAEELIAEGALGDLSRAHRELARFKENHTEILAANLLALDGRILATSATPRLTGLPSTAAERDFPRIVASLDPKQPLELTRPLFGPVVKRWILPMRFTVSDGQGRPLAFIVAAAPVEMLQSFWSNAPVIAKAAVSLVRDDGYLISRYPIPGGAEPAEVYGKPRVGAVFRYISANGWPASGYVEGATTFSNEPSASVFKRLEHFPVTLVVATPLSEIRAIWWGRVKFPLFFGVILTGLWGVVWRVLHRREQRWAAERQAREDRLRMSEALLERTGRMAAVGGWAVDLATGQTTWSAQTRRIHEVADDFVPTFDTALSFYDLDARRQIEAAVERGRRDGTPWDLELPLRTATGRSLWVRAKGEVESAGEVPVRLIGTVQDVTADRQRRIDLQQEQALRAQAERHAIELDHLLRERGEMLDVLAHEVRQPLNNASAALQSATAALARVDPPVTRQSLDRARHVLTQVVGSLDNTLAMATLLATTRDLRREDTDIDLLVDLAIGDLPTGEQERVRVQRDTPTRTAAMDLGLMRLALRNLLMNAVLHGRPGAVITVRIADSDAPLALLIEVANEGPPLDPALLPRLFERGVRGGHRDRPGLGIGLYIIRRVMELHGGEVVVIPRSDGVTMRLVLDQSTPP